MTDAQKMQIEIERIQGLLAEAVEGVEADGGDVRFFNAAFMTAAIQLHCELEGAETIMRAISKIGARELVRVGAAHEC